MDSFLTQLLMQFNISFQFLLEFLVGILFIALIISLLLFMRHKKQTKRRETKHQILESILNSFNMENGLDESLNSILSLFIPMVKGQGYYFYLLNDKKEYILKAFRYSDSDQANIAPCYAGLAPYQKDYYIPPINIQKIGAQSTLIKDGEVPIVEIPIYGGKGVVRICPILPKGKINYVMLNFLAEKLQPMVEAMIKIDRIKNQVEVVVSSSKAVKAITDAAMNFKGTVNMIMGLCLRMINASGGCLLFPSYGKSECVNVLGLDNDLEVLFSQDGSIPKVFDRLLEHKDFVVCDRDEPEFFHIPSYLVTSGMEKIFLVRVSINGDAGIAAFWFNYKIVLEKHRVYGLQMVLSRLGDAMESYRKYQELSISYLEVLKVLVNTVDNIDPYMVGYSNLMSRYAGIIAKEMKLDDQVVKDIVLAGFLSNIGTIGMSTDLLVKEGKYSEIEYETMKLHCDVGASIVEVTLGNKNIASYIRCHHERMDGFGYPSGLKGEEIPLGARIIAVVQFFIAKIIGRRYREPLPFEKAIILLKGASSTQLDGKIVEVLVNWFKKKQSNSSRIGKSLGPCWEMRCSTESICNLCPAYKNTIKNCWEYQGVKCIDHGNTCASCFIYTEFVYRTQELKKEHGGIY